MTTDATVDRWLLGDRLPHPRARLIAFPHAGGAAAAYRQWSTWAGPDMELHAVQYPGRAGRFREPAHTRCEPLALDTAARLQSFADLPLILFGHSMGALVAFEVAVELERTYGIRPAHLIVSGAPAPSVPSRTTEMRSDASDDALVRAMRELGGSKEEVLADPELLPLILSVMRADLTIGETYRPRARTCIAAPVTVMSGVDDDFATAAAVQGWQEYTTGEFRQESFPGAHFYLHADQARQVFDRVRELVERCAADGARQPGGRRSEHTR
ncbi:thioesterase II family protein [Streptomyces sp. NPDC029674]|uniref:thioesterase II family protein n=1 Tax=Streptomyces sp. NPDC029674 TaxID=3365297 RepID=UPI00384EBC25